MSNRKKEIIKKVVPEAKKEYNEKLKETYNQNQKEALKEEIAISFILLLDSKFKFDFYNYKNINYLSELI